MAIENSSLTYRDSGVDIDAADELIRRIRKPIRSTFDKNVLADIGHFGALYRANFKGMRDPVLVSSVDGVGTKLKIAIAMNRHDTVGQDLVNHCVNDILCCGARPLYFMDYFASGSLAPDVAERVILGFVKACKENSCSLVGGETAEMPGMYADGDYDIAGTIVGVVERSRLLDGKRVVPGDIVIGLPSTGLHTNGFSLARKALLDKYSFNQHLDELGTTVGDALLAIHRSYLPIVGPLTGNAKYGIHAIAHITGGGIEGNAGRVIPRNCSLRIEWNAWERPPIFRLIQRAANTPESDLRRTMNLGIGMVLIVSNTKANAVLHTLRKRSERPVIIGEVVRRDRSRAR